MARRIEVEIVGNTRDLERALGKAEKSTSSFGSALKKGGLVAGAALGGLVIAGKSAAEAASNLGESVNAVNVVFGKASKQVLDFSEKAAKEAGLSMRQFNELVTPIGASLQNVGYSADQAAKSSIALAKRAADMASVFNVDVDEALGAIQAGLRGEADPLERFGVGLSDAAVKAYALSHNLADSEKAITANDKAQARLALIMEQSNKVAGDFANTSDGVANSQRVAAAQFENLQAQLGEKLLPVIAKVMGVMVELIEWAEKNWPKAQKVISGAIEDITPTIKKLQGAIEDFVTDVQRIWERWGDEISAVTERVFGFIKTSIENAMKIIQGVIDVVMGLISGDWGRAWDGIKGIVDGTLGQIGNMLSLAIDTLSATAKKVGEGIKNAVVGALEGIAGAAWDVIKGIGTKIGEMAATIAGWGTGIGTKIKNAVVDALVGIGSAAWNVIDKIGSFIADKVSTIIGWGTGIGEKIKEAVPKGLEGIGKAAWETIDNIGSKISEMAKTIKEWGSGIVSKIIDGIVDKGKDLWEGIKGIFTALPGKVKDLLGISSPSKVFSDIGVAVVEGLIKGIWKKKDDLLSAAWDLAKQLAGAAWDKLMDVGSGIADTVGGGVGAIGGAIAGGQTKVKGSVTGDVAGLKAAFLEAMEYMAGGVGRPIFVQSGFRSRAEQEELVRQKGLYDPVTNPTGAAAPGTSKHEFGIAADITPGREVFGTFAGGYGLNFPLPKEPWHVETFDRGGKLMPGWTLARNMTGRPERVLPPSATGGGTVVYNISLPNYVGDKRELIQTIRTELGRHAARN